MSNLTPVQGSSNPIRRSGNRQALASQNLSNSTPNSNLNPPSNRNLSPLIDPEILSQVQGSPRVSQINSSLIRRPYATDSGDNLSLRQRQNAFDDSDDFTPQHDVVNINSSNPTRKKPAG